jgi:purine nucleosidase
MRIHLDTDLGGDTDDACALAMVLGWPDADLVGVTTNLDIEGQRAGCVWHCLRLAGREDVPVAAGAGASLTTLALHRSTWGDRRYWPDPVEPRPSPPGDALDLLASSIDSGATIVAIGAYTNLALLAVNRPGILDGVRVVAMGGWIDPPAAGLPQWGAEMDWNVQCDTRAAEILLATGADVTLATLPVTMLAQLRTAHLPRLRAAGALGRLLALQAETHAVEYDMTAMGRAHAGLADDLLNFQYDAAACAVALRWAGATTRQVSLATTITADVLRFRRTPTGRTRDVLVDIEADAFADTWLDCVEATP